MKLRLLTVPAFMAATADVLTADWSPRAAARYLDARQRQWFEWKPPAGRRQLTAEMRPWTSIVLVVRQIFETS